MSIRVSRSFFLLLCSCARVCVMLTGSQHLIVVVDKQFTQGFDILFVGPLMFADHCTREIASAAAEDDERCHEEKHKNNGRDRLASERWCGGNGHAVFAISGR